MEVGVPFLSGMLVEPIDRLASFSASSCNVSALVNQSVLATMLARMFMPDLSISAWSVIQKSGALASSAVFLSYSTKALPMSG